MCMAMNEETYGKMPEARSIIVLVEQQSTLCWMHPSFLLLFGFLVCLVDGNMCRVGRVLCGRRFFLAVKMYE